MAAFERKELISHLFSTEARAEALLDDLREIQHGTWLWFEPSDSFQVKIDMLEARMAVIVEEITELQIEGENV